MLELIKEVYYDHHNLKVYITPCAEKGVLHKKLIYDYEIINKYEAENSIHHEFLVFNTNKDGNESEDWKKLFKINKFIINDTDLSDGVGDYVKVNKIPPKEHIYYDTKITFHRKLQDCKKHKVKLELEYDVPFSDKEKCVWRKFVVNYYVSVIKFS